MLIDPALLDERVEDVEDGVGRPDLACLSEGEDFLIGAGLDAGAPDTEGLELVDEFVDDVPEPLFGEGEGDGVFGVYSSGLVRASHAARTTLGTY
jgi:hypothetical protein